MLRKNIARIVVVLVLMSICSTSTVPKVHAYGQFEETETYIPALCPDNWYYYGQLNDSEKHVYEELINSTDRFLNGETITIPISEYDEKNKKGYGDYHYFVKRVIKAYTYDNPEAVIWFENYDRTYYIADEKDYVYMVLTPKKEGEETSSLNANNLIPELYELQEQAREIVEALDGTDAMKVTQIHNWLIGNVIYDRTISFPDRDNPYGPIMKGQAICSGYAYAFKYIADLAGLDAIYVVGKAYNSDTELFLPHAWNLVKIDEKWSLVDVTFDESFRTKYLFSEIDDREHYQDTSYGFVYPK